MTEHTPETIQKLKRAPETPGVHDVILSRWSPRGFADKAVPSEELKKLFEAARWAASSFNEQPWRFIVGHRGDGTYNKIFDSLVEFNQSWVKSAPVLMLSVAKKTFNKSGEVNRHAMHDTGAATANLMLQATAQGLHTHSMAGFDPKKVRKSLGIPDDYEIGAATAIGYLGDPNTLPERLRGQETAPRERKPLDEIVFSAWGTPAKL